MNLSGIMIGWLLLLNPLAALAGETGIVVGHPAIIAKCGSCHARDEQGQMEHISWLRATPEGWQNVLRRMIAEHGVTVNPAEARAIVTALSNTHGLAPAEAAAVRFIPERRFQPKGETLAELSCTNCHGLALALTWRRSESEWKQFVAFHAARKKFTVADADVATMARAAPLWTPEWQAWATHSPVDVAGRWLVTATLPGRGKYCGELEVERTPAGDLVTRATLTSLADGSVMTRTGRGVIYSGSAWRGRSADGTLPEAREVMTLTATGATAEGRWFWGQYQEFGFDVHLRRMAPGPALLALDRVSLQLATSGNRVRFVGTGFAARGGPKDLDLGPGVTIRKIISRTPREIVAEVDVASDAPMGRRTVTVHGAVLPDALAIYDRVDYVKVTPDSAVASYSDEAHPIGYMQFEAVGYQRGLDGKLNTEDDLELGPLPVTWSLEVFHAPAGQGAEHVGTLTTGGLFTPAAANPNANFDVWISATAKDEKNASGKPLIGKSYLVVTPPTYVFNGRRYTRDLDRWIDDGPAVAGKEDRQ